MYSPEGVRPPHPLPLYLLCLTFDLTESARLAYNVVLNLQSAIHPSIPPSSPHAMRFIFFFALILLLLHGGVTPLHAQLNSCTPDDIRPLTKLPWLEAEAEARPLDAILHEIFHEPNGEIRYAVLDGYLSMIPAAQLAEAYDKCIILEGTQTPDQLVELLLRIWSRRDPHACWAKAKTLFDLVGIEDGFLSYDNYSEEITVQNRDAIRASRYWLRHAATILGFTTGLQQSSLSEEEQVRLMKECADLWFARFKTWPNARLYEYYNARQIYASGELAGILRAYDSTLEEIKQRTIQVDDDEDQAEAEIELRRWLVKEPHAAVQILDKIAERNTELATAAAADIACGRVPECRVPLPFPSTEWLLLWRTLEREGMLAWATQSHPITDNHILPVRALLLSSVDARMRSQWLKDAADADPDGGVLEHLISEWAVWDPRAAMDAAIKTGNSEIIKKMPIAFVTRFEPLNACHAQLGFLRDFDVRTLRQLFSHEDWYDWGTEAMESWGKIDVGEAARYGVDFLMKVDYVPRSQLITLFNGQSQDLTDTGDIIDRTFCCLRVWAVVRPDEMKAWIPTIQDSAMRDALTYILEHPWGTAENAGK
jgi:hypothetical protein